MKRAFGSLFVLLLVVVAMFPPMVRAQSATFTATGNMSSTRGFPSATLLPNGQVLIAGNPTTNSLANNSTADIYDPVTGTFTALGKGGSGIATTLADGRVLFIVPDLNIGNRAEIFDPATGAFTSAGHTATGQVGGYATLLTDGQVLVAGGFTYFRSDPTPPYAIPELFDPASGTFRPTGSFAPTGQREVYVSGGPTISAVVRLADGRVLFAGQPVSEVYDPVSGNFSLTGSMTTTPCGYISGRTATLLKDGKVLLTGGHHEDCGRFANAEIYDPETGTFTQTGRMSRSRDNHRATLLADGTVLITGGETGECDSNGCPLTTFRAEVYNPSTGTFTPAGSMLVNRAGHTATLLKNGALLLAGGYGYAGVGQYLGTFASAELYNADGVSPVIFDAASSLDDFNGDGKADILRRDSTGNVSLWLMNGRALISQTFIANVWTGWSIVGSGDFNGDGKADILWRDTSGTVVIWLMDGASIASYGTVGSVPVDWSISGVGDFSGDGKADILWRHSSGDVRVWLMDSYSIAENSAVASIWMGWSIVGIGDFNGDHKADVLWRTSTGDVAVWLMDKSFIAGWSNPGISTSAVAGVLDFNDDGKADILWRDSVGTVSLWLMDGLRVMNNSVIADIWTGWAISGVGDFNGDGSAGILWRAIAGHEVIWSMEGTTIASYGEIY